MTKPKNTPLRCTVTRSGILRIEIGIDTLAFSAVRGPYTDRLDPEMCDARFKITDPRGFALDVRSALLDEAEDGSNILTRALDQAIEDAIEDGSEFFVDTQEETP